MSINTRTTTDVNIWHRYTNRKLKKLLKLILTLNYNASRDTSNEKAGQNGEKYNLKV